MRLFPVLFTLAAITVTGLAVTAGMFMSPMTALAGGETAASPTPPAPPDIPSIVARPDFTELRTTFDESDEIAALVSVQYALAELGDGASYIWQRRHGRLSGVVQPTASFKDEAGNVCRHVVVMLTAGTRTKKTEAVACRLASGRWQIDG